MYFMFVYSYLEPRTIIISQDGCCREWLKRHREPAYWFKGWHPLLHWCGKWYGSSEIRHTHVKEIWMLALGFILDYYTRYTTINHEALLQCSTNCVHIPVGNTNCIELHYTLRGNVSGNVSMNTTGSNFSCENLDIVYWFFLGFLWFHLVLVVTTNATNLPWS